MKLQTILSTVATVSRLTLKYISSASQKSDAVNARSAFMITAHQLNIYTQEEIENFVNKKHGAIRTAYQKEHYSEVAEILRKTKTLLAERKRPLKRNNTSGTEIKKISVPELLFLISKFEIIMLNIKRYNNRVTIYDIANDYKKVVNKRVSRFIIDYYINSRRYEEMPYSQLKKVKKELRLPAVQQKLFNQFEIEF